MPACHTVNEGEWSLKTSALSEACFVCHDQKVSLKLTRNDETLADCGLCHNPHGSTEKFHLKMSREIACKQCHG
jgi:predicted CXXCH cytochrome family protein